MNRRQFLAFLSVGAAAATVAPHVGLLERIRSYFFAPRGGWLSAPRGPIPNFVTGVPILKLEEIDRLMRDVYMPAILTRMQTDSAIFDAIARSEEVARINDFSKHFAGIQILSNPRLRPGEVVRTRGNWHNLERFPFPGTLTTPIVKARVDAFRDFVVYPMTQVR